ncbi:hypothetical protein T492DRAFT_143303 [Pavlovales sp. CCMP2436]|nr:hypothetical protein T492DRAFT_143303 [Pavlovales sp. CCMP2436]
MDEYPVRLGRQDDVDELLFKPYELALTACELLLGRTRAPPAAASPPPTPPTVAAAAALAFSRASSSRPRFSRSAPSSWRCISHSEQMLNSLVRIRKPSTPSDLRIRFSTSRSIEVAVRSVTFLCRSSSRILASSCVPVAKPVLTLRFVPDGLGDAWRSTDQPADELLGVG